MERRSGFETRESEKDGNTMLASLKPKQFRRKKSGYPRGRTSFIARALPTPDEVRNLPQNLELLFLAGQRSIAGKLAYYSDPEFPGMHDVR